MYVQVTMAKGAHACFTAGFEHMIWVGNRYHAVCRRLVTVTHFGDGSVQRDTGEVRRIDREWYITT